MLTQPTFENIIKKVIALRDLTEAEMSAVIQQMMTNQLTPAQIAGFLVALEMKSPIVDEVTAATRVMRQFAKNITIDVNPLIDIVGTGGDNLQTFNISTATSLVVAGAGGIVAKHGNRAVSSTSGSADVLEMAGVNLNLTPEQAKSCIENIGIGFLFAPYYHEAAKYAAIPRKELGVRTFFNLLGPLTNPANASAILMGVYDKKWLFLVANVLKKLNCRRALVVHSQDGLDEISISAPTDVVELNEGEIRSYEISPLQFGFPYQSLDSLRVQNPKQSLTLIHDVLNSVPSSARDIVILNAGVAIFLAGIETSIENGIATAKEVIASGKAKQKLAQLISTSQQFLKQNVSI